MKAPVAAEVLKLRSTRMPGALLLTTLCFVVLTVVANVPSAGRTDNRLSLNEPALLARVVGLPVAVSEVMMLLLGVLAFTQEFRYGTASATFLGTPRRGRVLTAKWLALVLASVPVTMVTLVASSGTGVPLINSRHGNVTVGAQLWQTVGAAFVVLAVFGVLGVAIGALVHNQVAAVVAVLFWMLVVEQVLISAYPAVGRWTPAGATYGILQLGPAVSTKAMLSPALGGLLLLGYVAVAAVAAYVVTAKSDIV